ncbi:MAG: hypothetical protein ACJ79R_23990 [Anaeromyxobacteraceae bacterium]
MVPPVLCVVWCGTMLEWSRSLARAPTPVAFTLLAPIARAISPQRSLMFM